jgi:hypothetical protein
MPLFSPTKKKEKKPVKNVPSKREERITEVPSVGKYEILDEYNIIPQTVTVEISWNPTSMESIYIANEPVLSSDEEILLKKISKNMEQIVKSSKNLPEDLSQLTIEKVIDSYLKGRKYKLNRRTVDKIKYFIKRITKVMDHWNLS